MPHFSDRPIAIVCHAIDHYCYSARSIALGAVGCEVGASRLTRTVPEIRVMVPSDPDTDWLDVLNQRRTGTSAAS